MLIATATMRPEFAEKRLAEWICNVGFNVQYTFILRNNSQDNIGVVNAYHEMYERKVAADTSFIAYIHDDVIIYEQDWGVRVMKEFDDPKVAVVGFGGALSIGHRDIYKTPYRIEQLARGEYFSNARDWEIHGKRETGSRDVAVIDWYFCAVRRAFLDEIGGWAWMQTRFHCGDTALCLMAHRHGWKVRMVGVDCLHEGGGTSITPEYVDDCVKRGTTVEREHQEPHVWQYNEFRDVLPLRVK